MKIKNAFAVTGITVCLLAMSGCGQQVEEAVIPEVETSGEAVIETTVDESTTEYASSESVETETLQDTKFDITLAFAGDISLDDTSAVMQNYFAQGSVLSNVIDARYIEEMNQADLMWINNEFCYSLRGNPLPNKMYTFRANPEHVSMLQEMGVDVAGLANNHIYDFGKDAFLDTLDTLDGAGIPYVGAGHDLAEAMSPVYLEADGVTIAYVAASRAEKYKMTPQATETEPGILRCYDNTLFLKEIREADTKADIVVALPHWGTEYSTKLEEAQTVGAKQYIDAGADAVIGAHSHCIQGVELYNGKPIVYSLGNFWFNDKSLETMLVKLHVSGEKDLGADLQSTEDDTIQVEDIRLEILPGMQSGCTTVMADGAEKERILHYIESISPAPIALEYTSEK
ncbi:MAG: CapA family protein [Lachnospiraceae bacterium]|nr:CapA family protein [Lachnospiraceae bacterium]